MKVACKDKKILITGAAGFIGFHLSKLLLDNNMIIGIDNMNDYYDPNLKKSRLEILNQYENFNFIEGDIADELIVNSLFEKYHPDIVVNLAAQAGVR